MVESPYREIITPEVKPKLSREEIMELMDNDLNRTATVRDKIRNKTFIGTHEEAIRATLDYLDAMLVLTAIKGQWFQEDMYEMMGRMMDRTGA